VAGVDGSILVVAIDDNSFPKSPMTPTLQDEMQNLPEVQPMLV